MVGDYIKAGKIAADAKKLAKANLKEGVGYLELCNKIDDFIRKSGAGFAFPVNLSVNEVAAHDTGRVGDDRKFKTGDLVKVDVGVHVNGFIADTAFTVEVGSKNYDELIAASRKAVDVVLKEVKPNVKVAYLGGIIEDVIKGFGFKPIVNLSGHVVEKYVLHTGTIVPNFDNKSDVKLLDGQVVAIEPFATNGDGYVVSGGGSDIYRFEKRKPVRSGRKLLNEIEKRFNSLPFARRWLNGSSFELNQLVKMGALHNYDILRERSRGMVSQAEETVIVKDKPVVTTRTSPL
jgi:methionyl aminopeptidase